MKNLDFHIQTLTKKQDVEAIHRLAVGAFGKDAMSLDLIKLLHWHSRRFVSLVKDENKNIVGYFAFFVPNQKLKDEIIQGVTSPEKWLPDDFVIDSSFWQEKSIYLESIVILKPSQELKLALLLSKFMDFLKHKITTHLKNNEEICVLGLVGSNSGKNLMTNFFNLELVMKGSSRDDEMDLMLGKINLDFILKTQKKLQVMEQKLRKRYSIFLSNN